MVLPIRNQKPPWLRFFFAAPVLFCFREAGPLTLETASSDRNSLLSLRVGYGL